MKYNMMIACLISMAVSVPALATTNKEGPSSGGGGFVVQCAPNPLEPEGYIELIDIYRGRRLGFEMQQPSGRVAADYFRAVTRTYTLQGRPDLADSMKVEIEENLKSFFRLARLVSAQELPVVNDYGAVFLPTHCQVRQLAYFNDRTNEVLINKDLWAKLDSLNQAALAHHEIFYRHVRTAHNVKNSVQTALFVAHVYSAGDIPSRDHALPADAKQTVILEDTEDAFRPLSYLKMYKTGNSWGHTLQFDQIEGFSMVTRTVMSLPYENLQFKASAKSLMAMRGVCDVVTPNIDFTGMMDIQGTQAGTLKYKVTVKTGEPIRMQLYENNQPAGKVGILAVCR